MNKHTRPTRSVEKLEYQQAAAALYSMGIHTSHQFEEMKREGGRPEFIPSSPKTFYPEYSSWGDFIEAGKKFLCAHGPVVIEKTLTYEELKLKNRRLAISTRKAYYEAVLSGAFGGKAPKHPDQYYGQDWEGWDIFLSPNIHYVSFEEARRYARTLGLKSSYEWRTYCREGVKPSYIPTLPDRDYDEFISWEDFLIGPGGS